MFVLRRLWVVTDVLLNPFISTNRTCTRAFTASTILFKYNKGGLKNENIPHKIVQLVNEQEQLLPPEQTADILARINHETHFLELVRDVPPIVKIRDKKAFLKARKTQKAQQRASTMEQKEIQMTWNVGQKDLETKLKKARDHLIRGNMVDIAFAPKSGQAKPTLEEMQSKMQMTVDLLSDVAKEKGNREIVGGKCAGIVSLRPI